MRLSPDLIGQSLRLFTAPAGLALKIFEAVGPKMQRIFEGEPHRAGKLMAVIDELAGGLLRIEAGERRLFRIILIGGAKGEQPARVDQLGILGEPVLPRAVAGMALIGMGLAAIDGRIFGRWRRQRPSAD